MEIEDFIINNYGLDYFSGSSNTFYMEFYLYLEYPMCFLHKIKWSRKRKFFKFLLLKIFRYLNFGAFTHDFDEFDAEAHPYGRYALISYLNQKRISDPVQ